MGAQGEAITSAEEPGYAVLERPKGGTQGPSRILSRHPTVMNAYRALVAHAVTHTPAGIMEVVSTRAEEISWVGHELAYRQALLEARRKD